jgi:DNA-binding IclR family transcriptional regulator
MPADKSKTEGYSAPAVEKAFRLLKLVANSREELRLSDLVRHLGYSKSTAHGLVRALTAVGALNQNPNGKRLSLGPAIVELAFRNRNTLQIGERVQPSLDQLRDLTGETVFFGMLSRSRTLIMAAAEAFKPMKISSPPGTSIPLLAGAVGKVFLSGMPDAAAIQIIGQLGLPRYTEASITHVDHYLEELAEVRRSGYAVDRGEYLSGVHAVATALGQHRAMPLAVWVVGFAESMGPKKIDRVVSAILDTAAGLRHLLHTAVSEETARPPDI